MNFFAELKHRHIYRVAAAYAVVAWVLLQLFNNLEPILKLPDWAGTLVLVFLIGGFPVSLIFAWMLELRGAGEEAPHRANTKLDAVLAGAALALLGLALLPRLAPLWPGATALLERAGYSGPPEYAAAMIAILLGGSVGTALILSRGLRTKQQAQIAKGITSPAQSLNPPDRPSIAVLPFANLSSDPEQEFFSDGITEEITSALAKVHGLIVIGRTSAFEFKGQNKDLRAIGKSLGVTHLIEGSVRKAGTRARITAQLIRANSGAHLWAENYDRELEDIFAIQEDIAQAIAASLQMPLGLAKGEHLVSNRNIDPESYQRFLRAKAMLRDRIYEQLAHAVALLESVVAQNANHAPAWGLLGLSYAESIISNPFIWFSGSAEEARSVIDATLMKAEAAARKAIQLDSSHPDGHITLARIQVARGQLRLAEDLYVKGLALDPTNPDALLLYSNLLAGVGRLKDALAMAEKLHALDPLWASPHANLGRFFWLNGNNAAAIEVFHSSSGYNFLLGAWLVEIYASMARYSEAVDAFAAN